jgi:hypothetical protein
MLSALCIGFRRSARGRLAARIRRQTVPKFALAIE